MKLFKGARQVRSLVIASFLIFTGLAAAAGVPGKADNMNPAYKLKFKKTSRWLYGNENTDKLSNEKSDVLFRKRKALISDLEHVLRDARSEKERVEFSLRLARLYVEEYYALLDRAYQGADRDISSAAKESKKRRELNVNTYKAAFSLNKARAVYRYLLTKYPNNNRRDEMLYFYAISNLDKNLLKEAMESFEELSTKFPASKFSNDALAQLGDYYFDQSQYTKAEEYYDKIIDKKYKPLIGYAFYKKAWCAYNTAHTDLALTHFKFVIENERPTDRSLSLRIRNEALNDIVLPFTDLKLVNKSISYFKGFEPAVYRRGVESMANLYNERGDYNNAIAMWENLLDSDDKFPKNPEYETLIVDALMLKNDNENAINRIFSSYGNYQKGSGWYKANSSKPAVIKNAFDVYEKVTRKHALRFHELAQKTNNNDLFNAAKQIYGKYLEAFAAAAEAPSMRRNLAGIQFRQGDYNSAATNFYMVYTDPRAESMRLEVLGQTLVSLDRQLNSDRKGQGLSEISAKTTSKLSDESTDFIKYSEVENRFMKVADEYLKVFPKTKDSPDIFYEKAYLRYRHHDFNDAYKEFSDIVAKYTDHANAQVAGFLMLDILNRKQDYPALISVCQNLLKTGPKSKAFRTEVEDVLRHSELKRIQTIEDKGQYKEAADAYAQYSKLYGYQDEVLYEKALYNASVDYRKASQYVTAVETMERFLRAFPNSKLKENMLLQVASSYEALGHLKRAAQNYAEFAKQYPKNPQAKNALRLAGVYYWGSGSAGEGERLMLEYAKLYPKDSAAIERDLTSLYESTGDRAKVIAMNEAVRDRKGLALSEYVIRSVALAEMQSWKNAKVPNKLMGDALKIAVKNEKALRKSPKGAEALAKVLFWSLQKRENEFYALRLSLPSKLNVDLEKTLQRKLAILKQLEDEYSHIASLGSEEWGLAAIFKTAAAHRHLAMEAAHAPAPAKLSGKGLEFYRDETKRLIIDPFNEKALALVSKCLDQSYEIHAASHWTGKCYALGSEIDSDTYPMVRTFYLPAVQTAVLLPEKGTSKIALGSSDSLPSPFSTSGFFKGNVESRSLAGSDSLGLYLKSEEAKDVASSATPIPTEMDYRLMNGERLQQLRSAIGSDKPSDKEDATFSYLNLLRLTSPTEAANGILRSIRKDPDNAALHNLLGLAYLEQGNLTAAEATWLSCLARGMKNQAVLNNLGVVSIMRGKESQAINYFNQAIDAGQAKEALRNLGFLYLKYRNWADARNNFEQALALDNSDVTSQIGELAAQIQGRDFESVRKNAVDTVKKFKNDPYARLTVAYFLIDVEADRDLAEKTINEFLQGHGNEDGAFLFQRALQDAKRDRNNLASVE